MPMIPDRGVMIQTLDIRLRSRISTLFGTYGNSDSGSGSREKWIRNIYRGVMIPSPDPDPELDSYPFGDSDSRSGSRKKWNHNSSRRDGRTKRTTGNALFCSRLQFCELCLSAAGGGSETTMASDGCCCCFVKLREGRRQVGSIFTPFHEN